MQQPSARALEQDCLFWTRRRRSILWSRTSARPTLKSFALLRNGIRAAGGSGLDSTSIREAVLFYTFYTGKYWSHQSRADMGRRTKGDCISGLEQTFCLGEQAASLCWGELVTSIKKFPPKGELRWQLAPLWILYWRRHCKTSWGWTTGCGGSLWTSAWWTARGSKPSYCSYGGTNGATGRRVSQPANVP